MLDHYPLSNSLVFLSLLSTFRSRVGLVQYWNISVHAMLRRPPEYGRPHFQGEAPEAGQVGRQPAGADDRGRK